MKLSSKTCLLAIVTMSGLFANANTLIAQINYAEACEIEMESANGLPDEFLISKIKQTDALSDMNLNQALTNARESLEIARALGNPDAISLCKLQILTIESLLTSAQQAGWSESKIQLTDDATPEQRLLWYSTLIRFLIFKQKTDVLLDQHFEAAKQAERECFDPHLKAQLQSDESVIRLFLHKKPMTDDELLALRTQVEESEKEYPFLNNSIVLWLMKFASAKRSEDRISALEKALESAEIQNNTRYKFQCNFLLGNFHLGNRKPQQALACFEASLKAAKELEAEPLKQISYTSLGNAYSSMGKSKKALEYGKLAKASPAFDDLSPLDQNALLERLLSVSRSLGNEADVRELEGIILPLKEKQEKRQVSRENQRLATEAAQTARSAAKQAAIQAAEAKERRDKENEAARIAAAASIARFWNYSILATLCVCLFVVGFVWKRLKKVSFQLSSEKRHARQSRKERDAMVMRLNRLQRMESLGLMAGSVAHDFNNILVGVLGNAEMIQMKKDLNDEGFVHDRVASIITSAEKAASLSRQMLAYSGRQTIARYPTNLNRLIRQYESVLQSACAPGQDLKLDLWDCEVISKIDPTQVEQIVLNLVTNSVEASSGKGQITITTGYETIVDIDSSLHGDRTTGGEFGFIEVRDKGKGVSAEEIERIFEPFYSSKNSGRGLGLAVVYGVVKGHDGFIQCRSKVGKGTSFRVLLPISSDKATEMESPREFFPLSELNPETDTQGTATILVIDDEESVLELCSQLLQWSGWNVITAVNGKEGLAKAEQFGNQISCLLLDVVMPEMGANELLNEFEKRKIQIPTVIMSGFSRTKLEFFLDRPNVVSIVQKPFHAMEIQQAVKEAALAPHNGQGFLTSVATNSFSAFPEHAK